MPLDPAYLADVAAAWQAFAPGAQAAGYGPPSATPVVSGTPLAPVAPPPNATGFPSLGELLPAAPPTPAPAATPQAPIGPPPAPSAAPMTTPQASQGTPAAPTGVEAGPPPPPQQGPVVGPDPHAFGLMAQAGGTVPAHEVETRGPSVLSAQGQRNEAYAGAIGNIADRGQQQAENEYQMALTQERTARLREMAYQQAVTEQEEELQARQDDFDATAKQMARLGQIDHGRFWASRSTGQKIAGMLEVMLSGFTGGASMVQRRIDDDIKAQETAYMAARDATQAKQTAFSAAMAKYQNVNAARAAARVASIDVLTAQLQQIAAQNRGNEVGNRAVEAMANLMNDRMMQVQNGVRFVQAQSAGRYWVDPQTGLVYNENEAKALRAKQVEYGQQERVEAGRVGGQLLVQRDKAELEGAANGGMGKENAQKLALEEHKATIERNALLNAVGFGQQNVKDIVRGTAIDNALSYAPAFVPGSTSARRDVSARESYNNTARLAVAAAYKLSTDATEPRNRALLEEYAGPYTINAGDNEASALHKMQLLRGLITRGAASKGVMPPGQASMSPDMPGSFTVPGKK